MSLASSVNLSQAPVNSSLPQAPIVSSSPAGQPSSNSLSSRSAAINWRTTAGYVVVATVTVAVAAIFFAETAIAGAAFLVGAIATALLHSYRVYQLNNANRELNNANMLLTQERNTASGDATRLSELNAALTGSLTARTTELQEEREENVRTAQRNTQLLDQNRALVQGNRQLTQENNQLNLEKITLIGQRNIASATLGQLQPQLNKLTAENTSLKGRLEQMEQNNAGLTDKLRYSQGQSLLSAAQFGLSQKKVTELQTDKESLQKQLEGAKQQVSGLENEVTKLETLVNKLEPLLKTKAYVEVLSSQDFDNIMAERFGLDQTAKQLIFTLLKSREEDEKEVHEPQITASKEDNKKTEEESSSPKPVFINLLPEETEQNLLNTATLSIDHLITQIPRANTPVPEKSDANSGTLTPPKEGQPSENSEGSVPTTPNARAKVGNTDVEIPGSDSEKSESTENLSANTTTPVTTAPVVSSTQDATEVEVKI